MLVTLILSFLIVFTEHMRSLYCNKQYNFSTSKAPYETVRAEIYCISSANLNVTTAAL